MGAYREFRSFPTRRSSDLCRIELFEVPHQHDLSQRLGQFLDVPEELRAQRSEEHTSELQSRREIVGRLLLEKNNSQPDYTVFDENEDGSISSTETITVAVL